MLVAIFDLDDVLIHEGFDPPVICKETVQALSYLKEQGVTCVVASYNTQASGLLIYADLLKYVSLIFAEEEDVIDAKRRQLTYYLNLYPHAEFHFFDDLASNISTARSLNIPSTLVDYTRGITLAEVQHAFPAK